MQKETKKSAIHWIVFLACCSLFAGIVYGQYISYKLDMAEIGYGEISN